MNNVQLPDANANAVIAASEPAANSTNRLNETSNGNILSVNGDKTVSSAAPDGSAEALIDTGSKQILAEIEEKPATHFPPYDSEAKKWLYSTPFPGAWSPILYIGHNKLVLFSKAIGRTLSLADVKCLIVSDGPVQTKCYWHGAMTFQTLKWLAFVPRDMTKQLEATPLDKIDLPMQGAFYVNKKGLLMALSGAVFVSQPKRKVVDYNEEAPLVIVAERMKVFTGEKIWGEALPQALERQDELVKRIAREKKADLIIQTQLLG